MVSTEGMKEDSAGSQGKTTYPSALPTTMTDRARSPAFTLRTQSCSPSFTTLGAVAPEGGVSSDRTAGWGVPEALALILTKSSKLVLAAGYGSAERGVSGGEWGWG